MPDEITNHFDVHQRVTKVETSVEGLEKDVQKLTRSVDGLRTHIDGKFDSVLSRMAERDKPNYSAIMFVIALIGGAWTIYTSGQTAQDQLNQANQTALQVRVEANDRVMAMLAQRVVRLEEFPEKMRWMQGMYDEAIANLKDDADHRRDTVDSILQREINK